MKVAATKVYQPIWSNGQENDSVRYQRKCSDRYQVIKDFCEQFNRPFSVLDVGANYGYFDFRLMEDFDCTCVMIDNKLIGDMIVKNGVPDRAIWICKHIDAETLFALSRCEHFDVVLGLAVLHHFDKPRLAYEALCDLGTYTFFEIPGDDDLGAAHPERHEVIRDIFFNDIPIAHFPSHVSSTMRPWYLQESEPLLIEQRLDAADADAPQYATYTITQDFDTSRISIDRAGDVEERDYIPGMNLYNFQRLGGTWPPREYIDAELNNHTKHRDFKPWNFILGNGIHPIDE